MPAPLLRGALIKSSSSSWWTLYWQGQKKQQQQKRNQDMFQGKTDILVISKAKSFQQMVETKTIFYVGCKYILTHALMWGGTHRKHAALWVCNLCIAPGPMFRRAQWSV